MTFSCNFQYLDLLVIQIKLFLINKNKCEPRLLLPTQVRNQKFFRAGEVSWN